MLRRGAYDKFLFMANKNNFAGAVVLGMHDALVSQTGIIAGLAVALADRRIILMTGIISAVAAGLSMAASNYLAERTNGRDNALMAGLCTGAAYLGTSALILTPFLAMQNTRGAMGVSFIIAVIIIFLFNCCMGRGDGRTLGRRFFEMLIICAGVSVVAFAIGEIANRFLGLMI